METVNGQRTVRYDLLGSGHRVVVLLPALGATCDMWRGQLDALSDYTVLLCETGGHYPVGTRKSTLADYAADAFAVMDAVGVIDADLVGLSMGGMVAQDMALAAPDRVLSLVLAATVGSYPEERRRAMRDRADRVERDGMPAVADDIVVRWLTESFRNGYPDATESVREMLLNADANAYAAAARAVADVDTLGRLRNIRSPALVVYGDRDASLPDGAVGELAARIERSETVCIPEASHLCNLEAAPNFNGALVRFLSGVLGDQERDRDTESLSPW